MEITSTFAAGADPFLAGLSEAMYAERQFSRIVPQVMHAVNSAELLRTLRRAQAVSEQHQQGLLKNYGALAGDHAAHEMDDVEKQISSVADSKQSGSVNDLTYVILITKIIRHKIDCYQQAFSISEAENRRDSQRMLGAALSDETATSLFLQEVAERLFLQMFPDQTGLA